MGDLRTRITLLLSTVLLAVVAALTLVSCSENPNEQLQSNEFFRPTATSTLDDEQSASAAEQAAQADQAQQGVEAEQDEQAQAPQDSQATVQQQQEGQPSSPPAAAQSASDVDQSQQNDQARAPLEVSSDVIRRYANPSYGYSFELVCSPFCEPNSSGIERVSFLAETSRALIGVDVVLDDGASTEALVRSSLSLADNVEFSARTDTTTATGEPAERFEWEEDRRATGGFHVRWSALVMRLSDVVVLLRAGAVLEDYEAVAPALERALTSFILPQEITARPGRYERFGFVIAYDPADTAQEFGQPTSNPSSRESGVLVLQSTTSLKAVLTWQLVGAAFYDGDTAITQSLEDSLTVENVVNLRDWGEVDGRAARTGEAETQFGEGVLQIRSFAWYCEDGGREFSLHVLDADDPESVALPLLQSFRCSADAE